jgi:excisionase family DNA binding protein
MPTTTSTLLTPEEAAGVLRVSPMTVRRLIRQGRLPAARVGGQYRLSSDALERVLTTAPNERTAA